MCCKTIFNTLKSYLKTHLSNVQFAIQFAIKVFICSCFQSLKFTRRTKVTTHLFILNTKCKIQW